MGGNMDKELRGYRLRGASCALWGKSTGEMDRDELIAFIGFLDELATRRAKAIQEIGTWDNMGDRISDAYNMVFGDGAYQNLLA